MYQNKAFCGNMYKYKSSAHIILTESDAQKEVIMQDVLVRAFSLIMIIVLGFAIKKLGWVRKEDFGIFSKIVLKITLPCAIITSFNEVSIDQTMLVYVIIGILCNFILGGVAILVGMKKGRKEQAFNIVNYGSYNIGAFTMPYISSFLGASGVVIVSLFDLGNSFAAAGINYSVAKSLADKSSKISIKAILKNMFTSVLFVTYIVMFIIRMLELSVPSPILVFTSMAGSANTFLAMLMIGIAFDINLDTSRLKNSFMGLLNRYLVSVAMALVIYYLLPMPTIGKVVLSIVLFSPIASMATGFTQEIGGDLERSSFMNSLSIIFGIIIMTSLIAILPLS